jgi:hypothetical protein
MTTPLDNLMRVTGMGKLPAEAFIRTCDEQELSLLNDGSVQAALDLHANRLARTDAGETFVDDPTDIIQSLQAGEFVGTSPAPSVSEADDDDEDVE